MTTKTKNNLIISGCLFFTFIIFTILVKCVDVSYVNTSYVGFSSLNKMVFDAFKTSNFFYNLTEAIGYLTFLVAFFFAGLGAYQFIKTKSIKKVDVRILILGGFYVLVLAFYVIFEIIVINYRPVLIDGELEASYPSSHTILATCIVSSAMIMLNEMVENKTYKTVGYVVGGIIIAVMIIGRLLSGVHWFTDIVGAVLLSTSLVYAFYTAITYYKESKN